jgi:tRNA A37 threonylcarbamoyladenosine modification protein TsaB
MLAFSTGKPVAGIPTLEALAYAAGSRQRPIYAIISVGAGEAVYAARYHVTDSEITREGEYFTGDIMGLAAQISEPVLIAAAGAAPYADSLSRESGRDITAVEVKPAGAAVAVLAARRLAREESDDVLALTPLYLKESTARVFVNKYKLS